MVQVQSVLNYFNQQKYVIVINDAIFLNNEASTTGIKFYGILWSNRRSKLELQSVYTYIIKNCI